MTRKSFAVAAGAALAAIMLAGCGNSSGGSGVTTASLLDGNKTEGEGPKISNSDPMARPVQVAWTAARAQRCGFVFNAANLRANFIAAEQRNGQPGDQITKAYDQTFDQISKQIAGQSGYCTEKKSAIIKADLARHMAGDYTPNLPQPKVAAQKGFFELDEDGKKAEPMKADEFWRDLEDKKYGRK